METRRLLCVWFFLSAVPEVSCSYPTKTCARFDFPTLNGAILSVRENSSVVIPFTIIDNGCDVLGDFTIRVTTSSGDYCVIKGKKGKCLRVLGPNLACLCAAKKGTFSMTKRISRHDNGAWTFKGNWGTGKRNIFLNVTYPRTVNQLTIGGTKQETEFFKEGQAVDVECVWDQGKPRRNAQLFHHGERVRSRTVKTTKKGQVLRYSISRAECEDAGKITCEVPGSSLNRSATILVDCK
ncbi:hypothetical protein BaRGS_00033038 [Batillaria attramentaria]|uniref:Ig-like domain-containing protein n=1 Tax=Batillaria attramentaria TaxID=370345 RepID=A0ABD0JLG8_9CAEN